MAAKKASPLRIAINIMNVSMKLCLKWENIRSIVSSILLLSIIMPIEKPSKSGFETFAWVNWCGVRVRLPIAMALNYNFFKLGLTIAWNPSCLCSILSRIPAQCSHTWCENPSFRRSSGSSAQDYWTLWGSPSTERYLLSTRGFMLTKESDLKIM